MISDGGKNENVISSQKTDQLRVSLPMAPKNFRRRTIKTHTSHLIVEMSSSPRLLMDGVSESENSRNSTRPNWESRKQTFGEYCGAIFILIPNQKKVIGRKHLRGRELKPLFVQFILENIWAVYDAVVINPRAPFLSRIATTGSQHASGILKRLSK